MYPHHVLWQSHLVNSCCSNVNVFTMPCFLFFQYRPKWSLDAFISDEICHIYQLAYKSTPLALGWPPRNTETWLGPPHVPCGRAQTTTVCSTYHLASRWNLSVLLPPPVAPRPPPPSRRASACCSHHHTEHHCHGPLMILHSNGHHLTRRISKVGHHALCTEGKGKKGKDSMHPYHYSPI